MATKVTISLSLNLSTFEELELMLAMSRYALQLFDAPDNLTEDQIAPLMEAHGKQLLATFIAKHGYQPEDSHYPAMDHADLQWLLASRGEAL